MERKSICVALVTYNRKNYLLNLLTALHHQTYSISAIVIIDNNSIDNTCDELKKKVL